MTRYFKLVAGIVILSLFIPMTTTFAESDIEGHWAENEIKHLIQEEIMEGFNDGSLKPNNEVTRAEFAAFLDRVLELPSSQEVIAFSDVKKNAWYTSHIANATKAGLIEGYPNGTFKPGIYISREDMAIMVQRAFEYKKIDLSNGSINFTDADQIRSDALGAVKQLIQIGVIKGRNDGSFDPKASSTRAGAATVIYRLQNKLDELIEPEVPADPEEPVQPGDQTDTISIKEYQHKFQDVVRKQAAHYPKDDGGGIFTASEASVGYYVNPSNFERGSEHYFQFLLLSYQPGPTAEELNENVLKYKGVLKGQGQAFIEASEEHNVNTIYLMAHALHETGNGTSQLSTGVEVGLGKDGKPHMVTSQNKKDLTKIKTAYNMFGIGAVDSSASDPTRALRKGSERAYSEGWFTPSAAIKGGAVFITSNYIGAGQDTLYKMKWNPEKPTDHQYATHVQWATIQARQIYRLYNNYGLLDGNIKLHFEVPKYEGQPGPTEKPTGEDRFAIFTTLKGMNAKVTAQDGLNVRTYPRGTKKTSYPYQTIVDIIGQNGGWYKVNALGKTGWVSGDYLRFPKLKVINVGTDNLNVRDQADGNKIGQLSKNETAVAYVDDKYNYIKDGKWYKINYKGKIGWIHGYYAEEIK